ncbi:MAG: glucose 1-dehydrogenase [Deltaproteobacteria bacterium]|nr:MAG: glucose 1-dehydrogenase [Deltaproteobacteria bacterium]
MAGRLEGKRAIISGGSRGIGAAIARAYAAEGAKVVISSRKQPGLDAVAEAINADYPDSVIPMTCHIGYPEQIEEFIQQVEEKIGRPHILVNNAATNPYFGPMLQIEPTAFQKTFDVNVKGYFEMTRFVVQRWLANDEPGAVVNVSSVVGLRGAPFQGVYAMTKAAIISMTQTLSIELGEANIRVNAIAPGLVDTHFASAIVQNPDMSKMFTDKSALKRYAQPEEIAGAAVFLGSDEASYITGQTLAVDGGYTTV